MKIAAVVVFIIEGILSRAPGTVSGNQSNTVVTTIMSNFGLYKALDKAGIAYEKTAVGDRYVYENMKAYHHLIGGE